MVGRIPELGRFISVGVLNTLIGLSIIYAAKALLGLGDVAANLLGYGAGLCISFALNGWWTFDYRGPRGPALTRFLLVTAAAYGMNLLTVIAAIEMLGLNAYLAQALGIAPYTLTSYMGSKYFAFARPEKT